MTKKELIEYCDKISPKNKPPSNYKVDYKKVNSAYFRYIKKREFWDELRDMCCDDRATNHRRLRASS